MIQDCHCVLTDHTCKDCAELEAEYTAQCIEESVSDFWMPDYEWYSDIARGR